MINDQLLRIGCLCIVHLMTASIYLSIFRVLMSGFVATEPQQRIYLRVRNSSQAEMLHPANCEVQVISIQE